MNHDFEHGQVSHVADLLDGRFPGHTMQRLRTPDGKYRYAYVSAGVQTSFGLDPKALMALDAVDHGWIHDADRPRFVAALEHSAKHLTPLDEEVRVASPDGGFKWVRSLGQPRRLDDGTTIWDGVALDVTDRREALEALDRALQEARRNEVAEGRFSYIAANDLLAPLAQLRDAVSALNERSDASVAPHLRHAIGGVLESFESFERALVATRELVSASGGRALAQPPKTSDLDRLTARQLEILELIRQGSSNRSIAEALRISEGTVKLHVSAILKRLGVRNRTQAASALSS
ncbi:MAG: LuxR C-terminal-related transcriptional regulator [Rhodobacter sp.]|nr:LuxR C-terminal-related transcriptional regulator [Rhodobacter sp.]